jgi:hypothetical protein
MNTQLAELSEKFRLNAKRAQKIVSDAGESRIATRPLPDSWSAAECLVHLTLTTEMFLPAWRAVLAGSPAGNGPYKMDLVGRILTWVLEPPPRIRVKAPAGLQPVSADEVLPGFLRSQSELLELVSAGSGIALDRIKIASPVASRVRYNVWSSLVGTDAHQRRHLWQAERAAGFSSAVS